MCSKIYQIYAVVFFQKPNSIKYSRHYGLLGGKVKWREKLNIVTTWVCENVYGQFLRLYNWLIKD